MPWVLFDAFIEQVQELRSLNEGGSAVEQFDREIQKLQRRRSRRF